MAFEVVLVTGADGPGIGSHIASLAAHSGFRVVACGLNEEIGEDVCRRIRADGLDAVFVPADLRDLHQCHLIVDAALHHYGRIDALVNNAGLALPADRDLLDTAVETIQTAFTDNAVTAYTITQAALPHLIERRRGSVVYISSLNAAAGQYGQVGYSMAKAALGVLARQNTAAYSQYGIRFNSLLVGTVPNNRPSWQKRREETPTLIPALASLTPRGRLATPGEVASVVMFFLSDLSVPISGVELPVDGGVLAAGGPFHGSGWREEAIAIHAAKGDNRSWADRFPAPHTHKAASNATADGHHRH